MLQCSLQALCQSVKACSAQPLQNDAPGDTVDAWLMTLGLCGSRSAPAGPTYAVATGQVRDGASIVLRCIRAIKSRAACSRISLACSGKNSGCAGVCKHFVDSQTWHLCEQQSRCFAATHCRSIGDGLTLSALVAGESGVSSPAATSRDMCRPCNACNSGSETGRSMYVRVDPGLAAHVAAASTSDSTENEGPDCQRSRRYKFQYKAPAQCARAL